MSNIKIPKTKEALKSELKKLGSQIGMIEIKRGTGEYIPMKELNEKKAEFRRLSKIYKQRYYKLLRKI